MWSADLPYFDPGQRKKVFLLLFLQKKKSLPPYTRIYFEDEAAANAADPVLATVPADRRHMLLARRSETSAGVVYRFDIHMQGDEETVFFDV